MTQKGIQRVAAAPEKLALQETNTLAPKKPHTRPIQRGKTTTANVPSEAGPANLSGPVLDGGSSLAGQGMMVDKPQVGDNDCDDDPGAMQGKRKRVQKTVHRDAVNAARAVLASPSVADGKSDVKSRDLIGKGRTPIDLKQAYTGGITTWAQKVHKVNVEKNACLAKPPKSLATSSLNQSTNKALSQLTRVTTAASTATPPPVTPTHSTFGDDFAEVAEPGCFPDEDNHPERMAAFALDVIEVRSSSLTPPPPPPSQYTRDAPVKIELFDIMDLRGNTSDQDLMFAEDKDNGAEGEGQDVQVEGEGDGEGGDANEHTIIEASSNTMQASKRTTVMTNVDVLNNDSDDSTPPTKRIKTETGQTPGKATGEVVKAKFKNGDLPAGCADNNTWRGTFIPTVAHATGGDNIDPWLIEDDTFISVLWEVWKVIYDGRPSLMNHAIVPGSAVYQVTKQRLSEWRGGFGSAAVMMFTTFMAADPLYNNEDQRADFADFWLEDNRWLFANIDSDDKKLWTGMWQSMFVLQTFAAHLNYTQGRVPVLSLQSEEQSCRTALALSGAAVKRALHLLSTKQMSFEVKSTVGKKKPSRKGKVPATSGEQWIAVISENETFSEPLWGYDTSMFLQAINRIPVSNMKTIIEQAQQYMKSTTTRGGRSKMDAEEAQDEDIDEEYADIFAFR
ncbi:hypothetical protein BD769DRAFT_1395791 [Suillus cothurnatus]|nr:hypothetical protein BD769DRAFT_1395791 [Suillus cothurnatus]